MRPDSDDDLVRYLVGDVPADEAERLDERSITDGEFALRLRTLENDLVDRLARGEAHDARLELFARAYARSPYLRDKVRFATALHALPSSEPSGLTTAHRRWRPHASAWMGLAAAAVLVLALAGYLGLHNARLRREIAALDASRAAGERQNAALQRELERARATPAPRPPPLTAVLLRPPRRGLGSETTTVSIPQGAEQVVLRLQFESDGYDTFWAALRDAARSRIVWRSPDVAAEASANERIVTLAVPASALRTGLYSVELTGVSPAGSADVLGHYPIRVVLE